MQMIEQDYLHFKTDVYTVEKLGHSFIDILNHKDYQPEVLYLIHI